MPRLKCAVLSLHEAVAVERVCLKKHLLFCRSKRGNVLQQGFPLLLLSCVAVGGVAEFRPAILRFYFEITLLRREILPVCERSYCMQTLRSVTLWR